MRRAMFFAIAGTLACSSSHSTPEAGACSPACESSRDCCGTECTNLANDPRNCGRCGNACTAAGTYCTAGGCTAIPCTTTCTSGTCCGNECCGTGQICCDPQGPLDVGPHCTAPDARGTCPQGCAPICVCASPDTPIATPDGERPIASLRAGDLVYSAHQDAIVPVRIARTNRQAVLSHHVMRVTLQGGTVLEISPGHPTADGRTFGDLRAGERLDRRAIVSVERVPYAHPFTYDILPDSDTGTYFAGGALIGSTLAVPPDVL